MVRERSIPVMIILSIVTCGIYGLYWLACLNDDLNALTKRYEVSGGMAVLLSIVTCGIYRWYWLYKSGEKVDMIKNDSGEQSSYSAIVFLLLGVFGLDLVAYALAQDEINKNAQPGM